MSAISSNGTGGGDWSDEEVQYLLNHYANDGSKSVAMYLGRSPGSVKKKWARLNCSSLRIQERWTPEDIDILRSKYAEIGSDAVGVLLGRSSRAVIHKASRLGIPAGDLHHKRCAEKLRKRGLENGISSIDVWKREIKLRDYFTCQVCNLKDEDIVIAHHIIPIHDGGDKFSLENGITLCPNCHSRVHVIIGRKSSGNRVSPTKKSKVYSLYRSGDSADRISALVNLNTKTIQSIIASESRNGN